MAQAPKNDDKHDQEHERIQKEKQSREDLAEAAKHSSIHQNNERDQRDPNLPAALQGTLDQDQEKRAAEARKLVDGYEKDGDEDMPLTTQTDQVRRSMDMETVGPTNWMDATEERILERGEESLKDRERNPRQLHGVAQAQRPR